MATPLDTPQQIKLYLLEKGYLIGSGEVADKFNINQSYAKRCLRKLDEAHEVMTLELNNGKGYYVTKKIHSCTTYADVLTLLMHVGILCHEWRMTKTRQKPKDIVNMISLMHSILDKLESLVEPDEDGEFE